MYSEEEMANMTFEELMEKLEKHVKEIEKDTERVSYDDAKRIRRENES